MSGKAIYEALRRGLPVGDEGGTPSPWLGQLARVASILRAASAMAEEEEAAWCGDPDAQLDAAEAEDRLSLAAADAAPLPELRYRARGCEVRLVITGQDGWFLMQVEGRPGVTVSWRGGPVPLAAGRWVEVPALDEPPAELRVVDGSGRRRRLVLATGSSRR